jgi:hypothetical protein
MRFTEIKPADFMTLSVSSANLRHVFSVTSWLRGETQAGPGTQP